MLYLCAKTMIGKMKDSPCQICIIKSLCENSCDDLSLFRWSLIKNDILMSVKKQAKKDKEFLEKHRDVRIG